MSSFANDLRLLVDATLVYRSQMSDGLMELPRPVNSWVCEGRCSAHVGHNPPLPHRHIELFVFEGELTRAYELVYEAGALQSVSQGETKVPFGQAEVELATRLYDKIR